MPLISKQEVIDAYGHFFVVAAHHAGNEWNEESVLATQDDLSRYSSIGKADGSWSWHDELKSLQIIEFFGSPDDKQRRDNIHVLGGPSFKTLEEAEARAATILETTKRRFEELRGIALDKGTVLQREIPDPFIDYALQPDQIEFPRLVINDTKLCGFWTDVSNGKIEVLALEDISVGLSPCYNTPSRSALPFSYGYKLTLQFMAAINDTTQVLMVGTGLLENSSGDHWQLYQIRDSDKGRLCIYYNQAEAETGLRKHARQVYENIGHLLEEPRQPVLPPAQKHFDF